MLRIIWAVIKKELRQLRRDFRSLAFLVGIPAFMLFMFGYALNFDVKHIPLAVCDKDLSPASRELIGNFIRTETFDLKFRLSESRNLDRLMDEGKVRAALIIPAGFADDLLAGRPARVQVILDGADATTASTAAGTINGIVQSYSGRATAEVLARSGRGAFHPPVQTETRVWYNPELRSATFLVPGLMAFILMVIVVVSTAFSVVREKERGTMEQLLVSPIRPVELIIGKTVPYIIISLISSHLVLLLGYLLFGVTIQGNYFLLLLAMTLFLIGGLGQGLFISTITGTQQVAFQLAVLSTYLPTFILSGFIFPIKNMPVVIQAITYAVPARYFLAALRGIILKGAGLAAVWEQLVGLAAFVLVTLTLTTLRMNRAGFKEKTRKGRRAGGAPR
jgi:ABC-2 type transport system permease protein